STEQAHERILRGATKEKSFSVLYLDQERLRGAFLLEQSLVASWRADRQSQRYLCEQDKIARRAFPAEPGSSADSAGTAGRRGTRRLRMRRRQGTRRTNIHPDLVAGVSIGAFNAAIIAANPGNATTALEAFWRELSLNTPYIPDEELRRS